MSKNVKNKNLQNSPKFNRKKVIHLFILLLASTSLPFSFNACGQQGYDIALQPLSNGALGDGNVQIIDGSGGGASGRQSNGGETNGGETNGGETSSVLQSVSQSVLVKAQNKTDILIVEDDSGSMSFEQLNMANRFSSFIDELKELDWQLGITTTDVSSDKMGKDGRLLDLRNSLGQTGFGNVLSSQMDSALVNDLFKSTIQRGSNEMGSGWEQGIFATYRFLERFFDLADVNASHRKLLRDSATLAIVIVTDADESPGSTVNAKNMGDNLRKYIKSALGDSKRVSFHSIIVKPNDSTCLYDRSTFAKDSINYRNSNEGYGKSYAELSTVTGGLIGSVCEADYGSQLKAIGKLVADSVKSVNLQCAPVDIDNDGMPDVSATGPMGEVLAITSINNLTVTFVNDLPLGSTSLKYNCKK